MQEDNLKRRKIKHFLRIIGRGVLEGIPCVGASLGKIVDGFTEKDTEKIVKKIEKFEKSEEKTKQKIEKLIFEILSMSGPFTSMWHENKENFLNFEADRDKQIYEFERLLLYDGPVERIFLEKNRKYLDERIKKNILSGNLREISAKLFNEYKKKGKYGNGPKAIIRSYLMLSDYFHLTDEYEDSKRAFYIAQGKAKKSNIKIENLLTDLNISLGHILVHLNDLKNAKNIFQQSISKRDNPPILKARDFFRIGEILVFQGENDNAIKNFKKSMKICHKYINTNLSRTAYCILADSYRRMGTAYRMKEEYQNAKDYYDKADHLYKLYGFRGRVWLLHGYAELYRAEKKFDEAHKMYTQAKIKSQETCNINRVAHAQLGICEINRMIKKVDIYDYSIPLQIYKKINSKWGIANTYISQSLIYIYYGKIKQAIKLLNIAKDICQIMKLNIELEIIQRIKKGSLSELHPLSLF